MTAPHFHTVNEAKAAIKKIQHNSDGTTGAPTGIAGGSGGNDIASDGISPKDKGGDWVDSRGIKGS